MRKYLLLLFVLAVVVSASSAYALELLKNTTFADTDPATRVWHSWDGSEVYGPSPTNAGGWAPSPECYSAGGVSNRAIAAYDNADCHYPINQTVVYHTKAWFFVKSADMTAAGVTEARVYVRCNTNPGDVRYFIMDPWAKTVLDTTPGGVTYVAADVVITPDVWTLKEFDFTMPPGEILNYFVFGAYGFPDSEVYADGVGNTALAPVTYVDEVALTADYGTVSGAVTDGTTGIVGATVTLSNGATVLDTTTTAGGGIYAFTKGLPAGDYSVDATKINYTSDGAQTVTVTTGIATAPTITMTKALTIHINGTVTDSSTGLGVVGATVTAKLLSGLSTSTTTGTNPVAGAYSLEVAPDAYTVTASKFPLSAPSQPAYTFDDYGQPIDVTLNFAMVNTVLIDINAAELPVGPVYAWINHGTLGGAFIQDAILSGLPVVTMAGGKRVVQYNGSSALQLNLTAPAGITGAGDWTVASWLYCATTNTDVNRTYLSWAQRGTNFRSSEMRFSNNYAIAHYGADNGFAAVPAPGVWHHIAVTYDGSTEIVYVDGVVSTTVLLRTLDLWPDEPVLLGRAYANADGSGSTYPWIGSMASLQVSDVALTADTIATMAAAPPPNADARIITASAETGTTISPSGAVPVMVGDSQTFTIGAALGYTVSDVKIDGVSQDPDPTSYTFTNVTTTHTIEVLAFKLPTSTISGTVKDKAGVLIPGATVYFSGTPNASVTSSWTTTASDGTYTKSDIPQGTIYVSASAAGYWNSPDTAITLGAAPSVVPIVLLSNVRNIPQTDKMWFSVITDTLPASGNTGGWTPYLPNPSIPPILATYTTMGSPVVQYVDNMKWERNSRGAGDTGFFVGKYTNGDPTTGLSIVAAVRPIYNNPPIGGEPRGEIVDIGYSELWLSVSHDTGAVQVCRRGYLVATTGYTIPDGQKTILSLIVTVPAGLMTLYANGVQVWQLASGIDYSLLQYNLDTNLSIGRNAWDGWSAFNGNIGDVFVYKTALSNRNVNQLQADLAAKFAISVTALPNDYTIAASVDGIGGTISPPGTTVVLEGATPTYTITADPGYAVESVLVNGVNKGAITSYVFPPVTEDKTIVAKFKVVPTWTITVTQTANGTITPGTVVVSEGANKTFTITPSSSQYMIDVVTVDTVPMGAITSYTFTNVTANHAITATFKVDPNYDPTLLIDIKTAALAAGSLTSWANLGTLGGNFVSDGLKATAAGTVSANYVGKKAVVFYNSKLMLSTDATTGDASLIRTPSAITGNGSWTMAAQVCAIVALPAEQYYFAFAKNDTNSRCAAFGYGTSAGYGAVAHWGGADMGWTSPEATGGPSINAWHHVAVTFDGITERVYLDGVQKNTETKTLDLWPSDPFVIGSRYNNDNGDTRSAPIDGAMASLKLYSRALTAAEVTALQPVKYTVIASAGAGGTITPSGTSTLDAGDMPTFTMAGNFGYSVADVVVNGVSVGAVSSYTFLPLTANSTIAVTFSAAPLRTVSGVVTVPGGLATVSIKGTTDGLPALFTTTDALGNYSLSVPGGTCYAVASKTGYMISGNTTIPATGDQVVNFTLTAKRNIPVMQNLLFAADSNDMGAVGTSGSWTLLYQTSTYPVLTAQNTPLVSKFRGLKYDYNMRADGDGYRWNTTAATASIPTNGASIVTLVKPIRNTTADSFNPMVSIFYGNLSLATWNGGANAGLIRVRMHNTDYNSTATIPDGQLTIISLVVQPNGQFNVYTRAWNGTSFDPAAVFMSSTATPGFTAFTPLEGGTNAYRQYINVGRNENSNSYTFNGYIGDTFVYKTALSDGDRATLEADIALKVTSTPVNAITATAGPGGTISPIGVLELGVGDSQTYTITPAFGYARNTVLVDTVNDPTAVISGVYAFTNVTAPHTIQATFVAKPLYAVTGKVIDSVSLAGLPYAKVYFSATANASVNPSYVVTADIGGNYTANVFDTNWYVCASHETHATSADIRTNVAGAPVANPDIALVADGRNIPAKDKMLFSVISSALTVNGATTNAWPLDHPKGPTAAVIGTPVLTTVDGLQWEQNRYASGDGYRVGQYLTPVPVNGVTACAVVQPLVSSTGGNNWSSVIDVMYSRVLLTVRGLDGMLRIERNGAWTDGPLLPNGQKTILTLVVQPTGQYVVFANGSQVMNNITTSVMTSLVPGVNTNSVGGYDSYINVGRNNPDGWTTYQGNIGDVFLYKSALSFTDQQTLETDLGTKFGITLSKSVWIVASAGAGGTINPPGNVTVALGANQTFDILPNIGYSVADVLVDGASVGPVSTYTFYNVTAPGHTIAATFKLQTRTIIASAGLNGTINPSGSVVVNYGANQTFNFTADLGFVPDQVTIDGGTPAPAGANYTFNNVIVDHTIYVTFKPAYTDVANLAALKLKAGTGETVRLTGTVTVTCKGSGLFFVGEESYKGCIKVVGADVVTTGGYLTNLTGLVTVDIYGQYTLTLSAPVSTATTGNVIKLVGANNKAAKTDAKLRTNKVRVWGNVSGSTIDDGYGNPITVNGGTLGTGVVALNGVLWQEGGSVVLYQNLP